MGEQAALHDRARRSGRLLLVAVGLLLLGVVAWSAARSDVDGGARPDVGTPLDEGTRSDIGLVLVGAAGMAAVLAFLPLLLRRRDRLRRERGDANPISWRRVIATVLLGLVFVYVMLLVARRNDDEPEEPAPEPAPEETESIEVSDPEGATGVTAVALLAAGAVVVLVGVALVHHRRRGRRFPVNEALAKAPPEPPTVLDLEALDPAGAVRAAYAGALHLLSAIGVARDVAETPREHLERVRTAAPDATESLTVLISRYEIARYSHHDVTDEMKAGAIRAYASIAELVAALTTPVDDPTHETATS